MSGEFSGWDDVQIKVDQLAAGSPDPFNPKTVANARDLLAVCRNGTPTPTNVAKGYWSTVCFSWIGFEIEVFDDRLEVYHFYDQRSEIWYEEHQPGESFTPRFLAELTALAPEDGAQSKGRHNLRL
jgi:hydroxyethylthiazole kinase-like sugar kinase family protein